MGVARDPVVGSGSAPACRLRVANRWLSSAMSPAWVARVLKARSPPFPAGGAEIAEPVRSRPEAPAATDRGPGVRSA
ncbi:hypothetical protein GCM10027435_29940 [Haloparvum alkalitolerans]